MLQFTIGKDYRYNGISFFLKSTGWGITGKVTILIRIILASCILLSIVAISCDISDKSTTVTTDSIDDVKSNIDVFMTKVFGLEPPSLNTYYVYESHHSENELELELRSCIKLWNPNNLKSIKEYAQNVPNECSDWITKRISRSDSEMSLYYYSLRSKFAQIPFDYKVVLDDNLSDDWGYGVKVEIADRKCPKMILHHIRQPKNKDLGFITVREIMCNDAL